MPALRRISAERFGGGLAPIRGHACRRALGISADGLPFEVRPRRGPEFRGTRRLRRSTGRRR